ncbi:MAG: hypothetical protein Q7U53_15320 [Anaerolineaceae bacterium]|nr:hypothetical protein [Anaerolineaceae bacterium]
MMNWNLKCGVIIIGSLLWQNYLNDEGDNLRLNWRNSHLSVEDKISVKVPIRYGRKSKSGMTMVFSNRMAKRIGFAYVVPLREKINNPNELLCECIALSRAEGMQGNFVNDWGVLAWLTNESIIEASAKKGITKLFNQQKINQKINTFEYKVGRERSCVTPSLKLDINWVTPLLSSDKNTIDEFHLLLATATKPMIKIPTYKEIAASINSDKRKYFINNVTHGIITHDDFEIAKRM